MQHSGVEYKAPGSATAQKGMLWTSGPFDLQAKMSNISELGQRGDNSGGGRSIEEQQLVSPCSGPCAGLFI